MSETNGNNKYPTKKPKGSHDHSLVTREKCVRAVLEDGRTSCDVGKEFGVPGRTIRGWVQQTGHTLAQIGQAKMEECAESALEYLGLNLQALNAQAALFASQEWLKNTDADKINSIAICHGILADKCFRLLEAADRAKPQVQLQSQGQLTEGSVLPNA